MHHSLYEDDDDATAPGNFSDSGPDNKDKLRLGKQLPGRAYLGIALGPWDMVLHLRASQVIPSSAFSSSLDALFLA
jgi:hypothetical protein